MWKGEKEEMTVRGGVNVKEIIGINVGLDILFISVCLSLLLYSRWVEQVVMML